MTKRTMKLIKCPKCKGTGKISIQKNRIDIINIPVFLWKDLPEKNKLIDEDYERDAIPQDERCQCSSKPDFHRLQKIPQNIYSQCFNNAIRGEKYCGTHYRRMFGKNHKNIKKSFESKP